MISRVNGGLSQGILQAIGWCPVITVRAALKKCMKNGKNIMSTVITEEKP
jgi:hypothetical protein